MEVRNERLSDEEFFQEREEVLAQWPTGKDVNLEESIEFHKGLPASKIYANKLAEAKQNGDTLIRSINGAPTLDGQIELVRYLVNEGGADLCTTHLDAFTRNHMFGRAEEALKESIRLGRAVLNGFPILIHGVAANRKLIESYTVPAQISGSSCDLRLNAEIGLAAGHTSISCGPYKVFFCYNRDTPLDIATRNWQYVYRLIGYYEERGVPIVSRPDGLSAIFCSRCITSAASIIEALIGAEQGVTRFSLGDVAGGNLAQDFAEIIVLPKLAREYLDRFGYNDVEVFTFHGSHQGKYPYDQARSFAMLSGGPLSAVLAGCQECNVATIDEAHQIPTKENNAASLRCAKMVINLYKDQELGLEETETVKTELKMLELETRAIVDRVIDLGNGDVAVGAIRATESGVLDSPFSTARYAARRVMGVRDAQGAGRFLDHGNLPFSKEIVEFHKQKIAERAKEQNREINYETVIEDFLSISEGVLISC